MEEMSQKGHTGCLFVQVKKIRKPFSTGKGTIRGKELGEQKIKARWQEYTEDLYTNKSQHQETRAEKIVAKSLAFRRKKLSGP